MITCSRMIKYLAIPLILVGCTAPVTDPPAHACSPRLDGKPTYCPDERDIYIVEYNRKYLWRNTWIINIFWFFTNIGLFVMSRNIQSPIDNFWSEGL